MKLNGKLIVPVFFLSALAALFAFTFRFEIAVSADPDRYFHLGLSRLMVESGKWYLDRLPQVQGLGWGSFFVEKEYLFHQVTALAYRLGGEGGVSVGVWLCGLLGILAFYLHASGRSGAVVSFVAAVLFFGSPILLPRLLMLRPHVLAISCFVLILIGAVRRSKAMLFVGIFLFVLSYHAFYIPVMVLAAVAAALTLSGDFGREEKRLLLAGGAALVAGILLNPYFPANLISGIQIAFIPSLMTGKLRDIGFGSELYPISSDLFLASFFLPLLVICACVWILGQGRTEKKLPYPLILLTMVSLVCLGLSFQSRRGAEYFLPATAFLFVELAARPEFREWRWRNWLLLPATLLAVSFGFTFVRDLWTEHNPYPFDMVTAARAIPPHGNPRVFNCEWDSTPFLFYARPNARFLDILDPSLLFFADEQAHKSREQLKQATVADAYGLLKNAFKADYVFCRSPNVVSQLERDPRFRRIFPRKVRDSSELTQFVYELRPEPGIEYVKAHSLSWVDTDAHDYTKAGPTQAEDGVQKGELSYSGYLDLGKAFAKRIADLPTGRALCAKVVPDTREMIGARYLALGGGRNIRMWKNGQPWFESDAAYLYATMHQQLLALDEPLKATDRLEFIVCSAKESNYWGFSLATLNEAQLRQTCAWKREFEFDPPEHFAFRQGRIRQSCLGTIAVPKVEKTIR